MIPARGGRPVSSGADSIRGLALAILFALGSRLPSGADTEFSRDILPILSDHCFACHGPDAGSRKGGLRLDTREGAFGPGKSGAIAVVPGSVAASEVVRRLTSTDEDDRMPPPSATKRLAAEQVRALVGWIEAGATWGGHWAYAVPTRPSLPTKRSRSLELSRLPAHPVDAFLEARLDKEGWVPAPEASRETLVRRVTLDLTGLPPTPSEVDAYLADSRSDAWERLVDRLLESPRYGERMAWEWLDAARYADSNGYQGDGERTMWPWRDWVVEALNRNLPFDLFSVWQLAGDLLPGATFEQRLATGFLRNHMINGEGGRIPEENRVDYLFDQTETVGTIWLGATLNCSRCHDHKFDPVTQRDYYGLLAYFNRTAIDGSGGDPQSKPYLEVPDPRQAEEREQAAALLAQASLETEAAEKKRFPAPAGKSSDDSIAVKELPKEIQDALKVAPAGRNAAQLEKLAAHWKSLDADYASLLDAQRAALARRDRASRAIPRVMIMEDVSAPRDTHVLNRGLYTQPSRRVDTGVPEAFGTRNSGDAVPTNRLGLARWLVSSDHPLTARVSVNRAWQSFFGTGLVKTSEDFGVQGEKPTHPELLDWLASEFMDSGWNLKGLHRLIVTSGAYRRSSRASATDRDRDPENRLLARGPRFRMPSWMIRDSALAVSGLLHEARGGPPVRPYQPAGVWEEATFGNKKYVQDHGTALYRRSLYTFWRRIVAPTAFFDVASRQTCSVRTPRTNVPLHALLTLNDTTYVEAARALASRLLRGGDGSTEARLTRASRLVLARTFSSHERAILGRALDRHATRFRAEPEAAGRWLAHGETPADPVLDPVELAAWTAVCSTILNLDEALTRE